MPSKRPVVALNSAGVVMATPQTITIDMPFCFFSDDNGPIHKIQVIVSEPAGTYITPAYKYAERQKIYNFKIHEFFFKL